MQKLFPSIEEIEQELKWREEALQALPSGGNQRRINYLRQLYKTLTEARK